MPIYEYKCNECETAFEKFVRNEETDEIVCPNCRSKLVEKQISSFAQCGGSFGGYGGSGFG